MAAWIPTNFEEACKRNAGRRKFHMRKRQARAGRIGRLLAATGSSHANESRAARGSISTASHALEVSKPTASRDLALVRRIQRQFLRMFGRNFDAKRDQVVWTWNWDHYGFITWESKGTGRKKPVGHFPFDTRKQETEESYCGFNQLSWQNIDPFSRMNTWHLIRAYRGMLKTRDRIVRNRVKNFLSKSKFDNLG